MSIVISPPPPSPIEPVVDDLHGVPVTDPYRWLEDQNSPQTRAWIEEQTRYARAYLDAIPGRGKIRERVRELLDVETYDSFLTAGNRYFFRKRLPGQEQAAIYFREVADGEDQLLIDPATRGSGDYTAVRPLQASPDGSLLLYEVKQGGERTGTFEILDVARRSTLADTLPHGYLRGFAFAPDGKSFYYVHEDTDAGRVFCRAAFHHVLGTEFKADREIFRADENPNLRLVLIAGAATLGFLVYRFLDKPHTDFYIQGMGSLNGPVQVLRNAQYGFSPRLVPGRIFALIDANAPNRRIVEVQPRRHDNPLYFDLIPEADVAIHDWAMTLNYILVCYVRGTRTQIVVFDRFGKRVTEIPGDASDTARIAASSLNSDEVLLERESFIRPIETVRCSIPSCTVFPLAQRLVPFDGALYGHAEVSFPSKDGTSIPLFLVGRPGDLDYGTHPLVMTAYGGFRVPSTPQFSVLVALLMEKGCVFALPCIRGGSEFGEQWHQAAKRQKRQVAFDDFLAAAEWLIRNGRTTAEQLAIFGGSNSGLLVGAALSQRPSLFRAVICIAPLLDMLRYHLFDNGHIWTEEFGNADNRADFPSLLAYSPYHAVRDGTAYPATLTVVGDGDHVCNALHARKMVARLQHASSSGLPVLLDYSSQRGHSPALPLATRINALTDRLAFLSCALELPG